VSASITCLLTTNCFHSPKLNVLLSLQSIVLYIGRDVAVIIYQFCNTVFVLWSYCLIALKP